MKPSAALLFQTSGHWARPPLAVMRWWRWQPQTHAADDPGEGGDEPERGGVGERVPG